MIPKCGVCAEILPRRRKIAAIRALGPEGSQSRNALASPHP